MSDDPTRRAAGRDLDVYDFRELERRLAEDDATTELGVRLCPAGHRVVVRGQVAGAERRDRVVDAVRQACPGVEIIDELSCAEHELSAAPAPAEDIR